MCTNSMMFANLADYSAFAIRYFLQQFYDDIFPAIYLEMNKRVTARILDEKLEFESDYSGETYTWQTSIPVGVAFQLITVQNIVPTLDRAEILRYSVEYFYKRFLQKEDIINKLLRKEFDDIHFTSLEIKFKPLKKK